ncbi:MAG: hypothetical protein IJ297_08120 [Clostridia bacterium]|nr:hypothetical protein [Clostridia bacterium]
MNIIGTLIMFLVSMIINFLPTVIAFVRGSSNKMTVVILNGIPFVISVIFAFVSIPLVNTAVNVFVVITWVAALVMAIRG